MERILAIVVGYMVMVKAFYRGMKLEVVRSILPEPWL